MKNHLFTKTIALSIFLCSATLLTIAQGQCIKRQRTLGGSGFDYPGSTILKVAGGIVVPGYTNSTDGNINLPSNHGLDAYLVKYNMAGSIVWKHTYGGSGDDYFFWASSTSDGGFIAIGGTTSNDGDVSGNHGDEDVWVVKLNSVGAIQWQKCYGGTGTDEGRQIVQTNYGYVFAGTGNSADGNFTGNIGDFDGWFVKLSHTGNVIFQKNIGSSGSEHFNNIISNTDGSSIIAGGTETIDGVADSWVLKLSASGNTIWSDILGGSGEDACNGIARLNDGNIVMGATSNSTDGDVTDNHGGFDAWVVKINPANGNVIWKKSFGDALDQGSYGGIIATADGGVLSFGFDGDFTNGEFTGDDALTIKMTANGNLQWQNTFGGSDEDDAVAAVELSPGQYVIGVAALSNDGDVHNAHGDFDNWLITIGNCRNHREFAKGENTFDLSNSPNPFSTSTTITFSLAQSQYVSLKVFDLNGRLVKTLADDIFAEGNHSIMWDAEKIKSGIYFLQIRSEEFSKTEKLIVTQ